MLVSMYGWKKILKMKSAISSRSSASLSRTDRFISQESMSFWLLKIDHKLKPRFSARFIENSEIKYYCCM